MRPRSGLMKSTFEYYLDLVGVENRFNAWTISECWSTIDAARASAPKFSTIDHIQKPFAWEWMGDRDLH